MQQTQRLRIPLYAGMLRARVIYGGRIDRLHICVYAARQTQKPQLSILSPTPRCTVRKSGPVTTAPIVTLSKCAYFRWPKLAMAAGAPLYPPGRFFRQNLARGRSARAIYVERRER